MRLVDRAVESVEVAPISRRKCRKRQKRTMRLADELGFPETSFILCPSRIEVIP
jgi:hypothetical protein